MLEKRELADEPEMASEYCLRYLPKKNSFFHSKMFHFYVFFSFFHHFIFIFYFYEIINDCFLPGTFLPAIFLAITGYTGCDASLSVSMLALTLTVNGATFSG